MAEWKRIESGKYKLVEGTKRLAYVYKLRSGWWEALVTDERGDVRRVGILSEFKTMKAARKRAEEAAAEEKAAQSSAKHPTPQPAPVKATGLKVGLRYYTNHEIIPRTVLSVGPMRDRGYGPLWLVETDQGPIEVGADVKWHRAP